MQPDSVIVGLDNSVRPRNVLIIGSLLRHETNRDRQRDKYSLDHNIFIPRILIPMVHLHHS